MTKAKAIKLLLLIFYKNNMCDKMCHYCAICRMDNPFTKTLTNINILALEIRSHFGDHVTLAKQVFSLSYKHLLMRLSNVCQVSDSILL